MPKTAKASGTVNPKLKKRAEEVLEGLGLSASQALNLFYMQVVLHDGLPFVVKSPTPEAIEAIREEQSKEGTPDLKGLANLIDEKIF